MEDARYTSSTNYRNPSAEEGHGNVKRENESLAGRFNDLKVSPGSRRTKLEKKELKRQLSH